MTMYTETVWRPLLPNHSLMASSFAFEPTKERKALGAERVCLYSLQRLNCVIPWEEQVANILLQQILQFTRMIIAEVALGTHSRLKEQLNDSDEIINEIPRRYSDLIDNSKLSMRWEGPTRTLFKVAAGLVHIDGDQHA